MIIRKIVTGFRVVLKAILWILLTALKVILGALRIFLMLLGIVGRIFLAFVRAAPD